MTVAGDSLQVWVDISRPLVNYAGSLGDMPLVVLSVTKQPRRGEQLTELQAELPALSSNSQHITVQGAYHEGLLSQQEHACFVTEAIIEVVEALRAGKLLAQ